MVEEGNTPRRVFVYLCIIILVAVGAVIYLLIESEIGMQSKDKTISEIYSEENKCDLILEQNVACLKGCNYFDDQIELWQQCHAWCQRIYHLEFDDQGDIATCEYGQEPETCSLEAEEC